MTKKSRNYSAEEKVRILEQPLVEQVAVSDLCDQYGLHPTVFHRWMKQFFENGAAAFEEKHDSRTRKLEKKLGRLEGKLQQKNEVLSELMEEHVKLKMSWGELRAQCTPPDKRDEIVDFVRYWSGRTAAVTKD